METIVQMIAIISFTAGVIDYIAIKPLRDSINQAHRRIEALEQYHKKPIE